MRLKDFDYDLPEELIARYPLKERDSSRLMVLDRKSAAIEHRRFSDIKEYLRAGDLLIFNDTLVIPARLHGKKETGGKIELLLVRRIKDELYQCMVRPLKGIKPGIKIFFGENISAEAVEEDAFGWRFVFSKSAAEILDEFGEVPLPPYIRRDAEEIDKERYQTIFAKNPGAIAAPTAGLHFTEKILKELKEKGVDIRFITLHTGPGTFLPVRTPDISRHTMQPEYYNISDDVFSAIKRAKKEGRRVIAVGSTVVRTIEGAFKRGFDEPKVSGSTDIFIYPPFTFKVADVMVTNFHLPESTLIMLVCAFAGRDFILKAYKEAAEKEYRFFSYGDCMLIL